MDGFASSVARIETLYTPFPRKKEKQQEEEECSVSEVRQRVEYDRTCSKVKEAVRAADRFSKVVRAMPTEQSQAAVKHCNSAVDVVMERSGGYDVVGEANGDGFRMHGGRRTFTSDERVEAVRRAKEYKEQLERLEQVLKSARLSDEVAQSDAHAEVGLQNVRARSWHALELLEHNVEELDAVCGEVENRCSAKTWQQLLDARADAKHAFMRANEHCNRRRLAVKELEKRFQARTEAVQLYEDLLSATGQRLRTCQDNMASVPPNREASMHVARNGIKEIDAFIDRFKDNVYNFPMDQITYMRRCLNTWLSAWTQEQQEERLAKQKAKQEAKKAKQALKKAAIVAAVPETVLEETVVNEGEHAEAESAVEDAVERAQDTSVLAAQVAGESAGRCVLPETHTLSKGQRKKMQKARRKAAERNERDLVAAICEGEEDTPRHGTESSLHEHTAPLPYAVPTTAALAALGALHATTAAADDDLASIAPPSEASEAPSAISGTADTRSECAVCFVKQPNVVILPCNHQKVCHECIKKVLKTANRTCPICRCSVTDFRRVALRAAGPR